MRQKKAKTLRKKLKLKLPVTADLRVAKTVTKNVYLPNKRGEMQMIPNVKRIVIINAAKYQYKQVKKIFKGKI